MIGLGVFVALGRDCAQELDQQNDSNTLTVGAVADRKAVLV